MNINGLWKCRPIILFSFHVSVVNRETLYVALGVKFGNSTLTCRPGLWRSNLTNDRESPNAGFTRFPSGSRLFRIHCDNLQNLQNLHNLLSVWQKHTTFGLSFLLKGLVNSKILKFWILYAVVFLNFWIDQSVQSKNVWELIINQPW